MSGTTKVAPPGPNLTAQVTSAIDAAATNAIDAVLQDVYTESSDHEQEFGLLRDISPEGWARALDQLAEDRYEQPGPLSFDASLAVLVVSAKLLDADAKEAMREDLSELALLIWPRAVVARGLGRVEKLLQGFPTTEQVAPGAFEHALFSLRKVLSPRSDTLSDQTEESNKGTRA